MKYFFLLVSLLSFSAFAQNEPWSTTPANSLCPYVLEGVYDSFISGGGGQNARTVIYSENGLLKALHFMRVNMSMSRRGLGYIDQINVDQNCLMTGTWFDSGGSGTVTFQFRIEGSQTSFVGYWNDNRPSHQWHGHRQQTAVVVPTPTPNP